MKKKHITLYFFIFILLLFSIHILNKNVLNKNPFLGEWKAEYNINGKSEQIATMTFNSDYTLITSSEKSKQFTGNPVERLNYKLNNEELTIVYPSGNKEIYHYKFKGENTFYLDRQFSNDVTFKKID